MLIVARAASAAELMVYPAKGQSAEQTSKDRYECHAWAVQESGADPTTAQPPADEKSGRAGREGLRGAATGRAIGSIAGDPGKGAAIGATAGLIKRGMSQKEAKKASSSAADQGNGNYQRALAACLEGRGYSVK